jgi:hypothetical protein
MALPPGQQEYQISYTLPAKDGSASLVVVAPAPTSKLMVMLPEDGTTVTAQGLESGGSVDMGKGKTRFYKASSVPAGQEVKLVISGIAPAAVASSSVLGAGSTQAAQMVAAAGAVVIVLFGAGFLLLKGTAKKAA